MPSAAADESLWVYVSHISRYASIHRALCGFCNDGTGLLGGRNEYQGGWRGPFPTLDTAVQQVLLDKQSLKEVRYCRRCL